MSKRYHQGPAVIDVLRAVDVDVQRGERMAILGRSGSGKSTLLHILGGLDEPDAGSVAIGGEDVLAMSQGQRAALRNRSLGFVYQFHHLLPEFNASENVALPLLLAGVARDAAFERANKLLASVGLAARTSHRPHALSGGERQRVAVARAVIANPLLVLADEPTGNLDRSSADEVFELMCELSDSSSTAFLIVTHDESLLSRVHTAKRLIDGTLHD